MPIDRKNSLGGSDIAALLGLSKWKSALDIYYEKTDGKNSTEQNKDCLKRGNILEPLVQFLFEEEYNLKITASQAQLKHPEYNFFTGHVDGESQDGKILMEFKTSSSKDFGDEFLNEIPLYYLTQIHWYMALNQKYEKAYVIVLEDYYDRLQNLSIFVEEYGFNKQIIQKLNLKIKLFVIDKNTKIENELIQAGLKFWNEYVIPKIPPQPSNFEDYKNLFPKEIKGKSVTANKEAIELIKETKEIMANIKELESKAEEKKKDIWQIMQDAEIMLSPEGEKLASLKEQISNRIDPKFIKENYPDIAEKCTKTTTSRILRLS